MQLLSRFLGCLNVRQEDYQDLSVNQQHNAWRDLPGHRHGKLFLGRPCKKRPDDLLKLSRHQLKIVVAILIGHAPVRKHLRTMSLVVGDSTCRFCRKEAETTQHVTCGCEALAVSATVSLGIRLSNRRISAQPQ
jgi:hypothetical protein